MLRGSCARWYCFITEDGDVKIPFFSFRTLRLCSYTGPLHSAESDWLTDYKKSAAEDPRRVTNSVARFTGSVVRLGKKCDREVVLQPESRTSPRDHLVIVESISRVANRQALS